MEVQDQINKECMDEEHKDNKSVGSSQTSRLPLQGNNQLNPHHHLIQLAFKHSKDKEIVLVIK